MAKLLLEIDDSKLEELKKIIIRDMCSNCPYYQAEIEQEMKDNE